MWKWLERVVRPAQNDEATLALRREVQRLRLDLEERERVIATLKADLERTRAGESARVAEAIEARIEELIANAVTPIIQWHTQASLLEKGTNVKAEDVLAVARRLVRLFENQGMEIKGAIGEIVPFDPSLHQVLGSEPLASGDQAVIKLVGVARGGKLLRKPAVARSAGGGGEAPATTQT